MLKSIFVVALLLACVSAQFQTRKEVCVFVRVGFRLTMPELPFFCRCHVGVYDTNGFGSLCFVDVCVAAGGLRQRSKSVVGGGRGPPFRPFANRCLQTALGGEAK